MSVFISAEELLEMYGIDSQRAGSQDFVTLSELLALCMAFPEYQVNGHLLVKTLLRQKRISPLVFWSRMKRDLMPILSADDETLDALGIPLPKSRTCYDLIKAVAAAICDYISAGDLEKYDGVMLKVLQMCREEQGG